MSKITRVTNQQEKEEEKVKEKKYSNFFPSQIGSQGIVRAHGLKQPVLPSEGIRQHMTHRDDCLAHSPLSSCLTKLTARVTTAKGVL